MRLNPVKAYMRFYELFPETARAVLTNVTLALLLLGAGMLVIASARQDQLRAAQQILAFVRAHPNSAEYPAIPDLPPVKTAVGTGLVVGALIQLSTAISDLSRAWLTGSAVPLERAKDRVSRSQAQVAVATAAQLAELSTVIVEDLRRREGAAAQAPSVIYRRRQPCPSGRMRAAR